MLAYGIPHTAIDGARVAVAARNGIEHKLNENK